MIGSDWASEGKVLRLKKMDGKSVTNILETLFVAVRRDPKGREYFDLRSFGVDRLAADLKAKKEDKLAQRAAHYWPVIRITKVKVEEITE